ncbi:MAG: GatB/YqeY domain-containing protein [Acidobacteriota bacterium]
MPSLLEQITHAIGDAMKKKDQVSLGPLRMLKAALMNKELEKGRALDAGESIQVVNALVKQRRDAVEQFRAGNRPELADKEQAEIVFLQQYLPPAADDQAIAAAIEAAVQETAAAGPKDMGKVMKAVTGKLAGQTVDGKALSEAVKNRLAR